MLRARGQKQVDFESLSTYLNQTVADRDNLLKSTGTDQNRSVSTFFRNKYEDFKGLDKEKSKQEKLVQLDAKIVEVSSTPISLL